MEFLNPVKLQNISGLRTPCKNTIFMKNQVTLFSLSFFSLALFWSCKKDGSRWLYAELFNSVDDQSIFFWDRCSANDADVDWNKLLFSPVWTDTVLICDATVALTPWAIQKTITVTYMEPTVLATGPDRCSGNFNGRGCTLENAGAAITVTYRI